MPNVIEDRTYATAKVMPMTASSMVARSFRPYYRQLVVTSLPLLLSDLAGIFFSILVGQFIGSVFLDVGILGRVNLMLTLPVALISAFALLRCYPASGMSPVLELRQQVMGSALICSVFALVGLIYYKSGPSVAFVLAFVVGPASFLFLPVLRSVTRRYFARFEWWGVRVFITESQSASFHVYQELKRRAWLGLKFKGLVIDDGDVWMSKSFIAKEDIIGSPGEIATLAKEHDVYHVIVGCSEHSTVAEWTARLKDLAQVFPHCTLAPSKNSLPSLWTSSSEVGGHVCIHTVEKLHLPFGQLTKRILDFVIIAVCAVFLVPLFACLAAAVRMSGAGPVFYGHERIGRDRKLFRVWKFRTMVQDADKILQEHLEKHPEQQAEWDRDHKLKDDPRITTIGKILRRTSLDELPQVWNVICGEMSLVGPRPIVKKEIAKYDATYHLYHRVRPGITGMWQISGRNDTTYEERVTLDSYYVRNWSPWLDVYILIRTIKTVVFCEGAY